MGKMEAKRGSLVAHLVQTLRDQLTRGEFPVGGRLPSEAQLSSTHGVSRTVVREAIAALRADDLVEPRQGAGVFVLQVRPPAQLPFQNIDTNRISSVVEVLELRNAVEVEAAGLAALRRAPAQEEAIVERFREVSDLAQSGKSTAEADFALHMAIADATSNSRFVGFLRMLGPDVIPRYALRATRDGPTPDSYQSMIQDEHRQIISAILDGDQKAARTAMRRHLAGSLSRYRTLLRETVQLPAGPEPSPVTPPTRQVD